MKTTKSKIRCGGMLTILVLRRQALLRGVVLVLAVALVAGVANADFTFGTPTNLGPTVNTSARDLYPSISADGLSLFFHSNRSGGYGKYDMWVTTRATVSDPWRAPVNLGSTVNTSYQDATPSISADGLSLYFGSIRPSGFGAWDVWVTTRATKEDPWGEPVNLGPPVNSSCGEVCANISADGLTIYFSEWPPNRPGGYGAEDLWVTTRPTVSDPWGEPVNLGPTVNSSVYDGAPSISADGLTLFFDSDRTGEYGDGDLWVTTRPTVSDPWGEPVNLGPTVNSSAYDEAPSISADGSTLYFCSDRVGGSGQNDIWQVPIEPVVDLNTDGIIDSADMCIIVDHWGTNESLCDIGPMPWGDGIVDVQDLIVLAEHLFEEIPPVE